ncbi:MAG: hypothetical protein ABI193_13075 [Minicystis sp.]
MLRSLVLGCGVAFAGFGCAGQGRVGSNEDDFTSVTSTLVDLEFDGVAIAGTDQNPAGQIRAQLLYTVGLFNGENGNARLGKLALSAVKTKSMGAGLFELSYHAKLPVAWNKAKTISKTTTLTVPKRVDDAGQKAFFAKYGESCVEAEGHEVLLSNLWFHYRPKVAGCKLAAGDVLAAKATVKVSPENAVAKYPEYHRVWEDGTLDIVAVFGKYEEGATADDDAGIEAWNGFLQELRATLPKVAVTPANAPERPGAAFPDVTFESVLADGRQVRVTALLVDKVATAPASFDARFGELTPGADLVIYDGHAGLGVNVKALTGKAKFFPRKYQLFFMNGCDTFAYEDDSLAKARALLNPEDPSGSKYLDVITNAMPAYFSSMPDASLAVVNAFIDQAQPRTYEAIFKGIDEAQVVVVNGETDNVYTPAYVAPQGWKGLELAGAVGYKETKSYATEQLGAGSYVFEMTPEITLPGGDADLHLKVGSAPTQTATFKCPSYKANSNERCIVKLDAPGKVFFTATGDKKSVSSSYLIRAFPLIP